ncbi:MAG: SO2930 family diheme c-type cytochrome [Pseudomonadales bacterium]
MNSSHLRYALLLTTSLVLSSCSGGSGSDAQFVETIVVGTLEVSSSDPLSENATVGDSTGLTVNAPGATSFSLVDDAGGRFAIDASTGLISVADDTNIDFEAQESHDVVVEASNATGSSNRSTFTINIGDETFAGGGDFDKMLVIEAGPDLETRIQEAMITAESESIIMLPQGTFDMTSELSISTDHIILRGHGMEGETGTVLRFAGQTVGGQSINATGDNIIMEDFAVEDSPADAIKVRGSNGVVFRRVRAEWTNGPATDNGAYGFYPVQTRNVLIEDCEVRGASDAGIYVGQSENIIVRRNFVYENVAGIEIENSKFADVYDNETTANTGGILVFDLPGPPVQGGEATRVFNNNIYDNNTPNFAPAGNIVGTVPAGTGLMIMANDDIEAFGNTITGNSSAAVIIVSYYINDANVSRVGYDPVPEKIYVHDNELSNNSYDPQALAADIALLYGNDMVDIFYDSSGTLTNHGLLVEFPDGLTESQRICITDNGAETRIGRVNASVILAGVAGGLDLSQSTTDYNCAHASLPEIVLDPIDTSGSVIDTVDTAALCGASGTGINAGAFTADCPSLSDYRLFANASDPTEDANGGIEYKLTTPLFTDYANKYRFLFVPENSTAAYRTDEVFDFPVGTIISKTFTIQSDLRDPSSAEELIETRLLIRRSAGWTALPYIWNAEKTDAVLTVTGGTQNVSWVDASGANRSTDYVIPNTNNCSNCHGGDNLIPIGPKARFLNMDNSYDGVVVNQLQYLTDQNALIGVPADTSTISTVPEEGDTTASLDDRARGYLDINCAHCHSPGGAADTSGLYLEYTRPFGREVGECKTPIAAGDGAGNLDYSIVPGDSSQSIMSFRMNSNEPDVRMPEIGRTIIHAEGLALVSDWIDSLPADNCGP